MKLSNKRLLDTLYKVALVVEELSLSGECLNEEQEEDMLAFNNILETLEEQEEGN